MDDYKNRKLTKTELAGVIAALIMFLSIGMIMGGSSAGNDKLFYAGVIFFAVGAGIALFLLFKYSPKDKENF